MVFIMQNNLKINQIPQSGIQVPERLLHLLELMLQVSFYQFASSFSDNSETVSAHFWSSSSSCTSLSSWSHTTSTNLSYSSWPGLFIISRDCLTFASSASILTRSSSFDKWEFIVRKDCMMSFYLGLDLFNDLFQFSYFISESIPFQFWLVVLWGEVIAWHVSSVSLV